MIITPSCGNVFEDLGFHPDEAKALSENSLRQLRKRHKCSKESVRIIRKISEKYSDVLKNLAKR